MSQQSVQETLQALRREYAASLNQKIATIESQCRALAREWDSEPARLLQENTHQLAGSAGSYGFREVSRVAAELDGLLRTLLENEPSDPTAQSTELTHLIDGLKVAAEAIPARARAFIATGDAQSTVFVVDDDDEVNRLLQLNLEHHGFQVRIFNKLDGLFQAIQETRPDLLVMDIMLTEGSLAGPKAVYTIEKHCKCHVPVIFISARDDMKARLASVRANADAYFTKPLDLNALIAKIDFLTSAKPRHFYRILLVDSEGEFASRYADILTRADMEVKILREPMEALALLETYPANLLMIHSQLSGLSGTELAMIIRQNEHYLQLPILFFAQRFDQTLRRAAMRGVGDDFLEESITPEQLVATVTNHLRLSERRQENQRDQGNRDRLTGFYNRPYLLTRLELLHRHREPAQPLGILFVELDNYRGIDQIMGPIATEKAMVETAALIREHVDRQDWVARYSDGSFVILAEERGLDHLRALAEKIRAPLEGRVIRVTEEALLTTCSIGIGVAHASQARPETLLEGAMDACRQAREAGGNRVEMHDSAHAARLDEQHLAYWRTLLEQGFRENRFYLGFQPITPLHGKTEKLHDVLLRLRNPEGGEGLQAGRFMAMAARCGLEIEIDQWVVRQALETLYAHPDEEFGLFVRLSGAALSSLSFLEWLRDTIFASDLPPANLVFDLAEEDIEGQLKKAQAFTSQLKKLGARICLRNYSGTAQSRQFIQFLPLDFVKLNAETVHEIAHGESVDSDRFLHLVGQIHDSAKPVIAPFVESMKTLELMWQFGVDYIAGYFVQGPEEKLDLAMPLSPRGEGEEEP